MSSLVEITIPQQPEITHYRANSQNTSIYLILGTNILEILSLHCFCGPSPYFQKLSNAIKEIFTQAQSKYSNIAQNLNVLNDILINITEKASSVQQSLGWILGYTQNNEYGLQISQVFKHVLWTTSNTLANREYEHSMIEEVLKTYSAIFQIKIVLLLVNGEKRCFYEQLSGRCPVMCLLYDESNIFSVYSREMLAIENGSETNPQVIFQSPQMMFYVIPPPGAQGFPNPVNPTNSAANYSSPGNGSFLPGVMPGRMQNTPTPIDIEAHRLGDLPNPVGNSFPPIDMGAHRLGDLPNPVGNSFPPIDIGAHRLGDLPNPIGNSFPPIDVGAHRLGNLPNPIGNSFPPIDMGAHRLGDLPNPIGNSFPPIDMGAHRLGDLPNPIGNSLSPGGNTDPWIGNPPGVIRNPPPQRSIPLINKNPEPKNPPHQPYPIPVGLSLLSPRNMQENLPLPIIDNIGEDLVSKRTDISCLELSPTLTDELRCSYSHCIRICRSYNPITAFAEALQQFFKLESNKDIKKRIISSFQQKRNFSNLDLDKNQNYSINKDTVVKLRKTMIKISTQALSRAEDIDEEAKSFKEMQVVVGNEIMFTQLSDGPQPDYFLLTILCKIFGFTAIITEQSHSNSEIFEKTQLNGRVLGYRPELHFISLRSDEGYNHLHVLLTNSHVFEDKFNIQEQRPAANRTITQIFPNRSLDFPSKPPQVNETSPVDFLIELTRVQDQALESLRICIAKRIPLMMDTVDIDLKTRKLTDLTRDFDYPQFQERYRFEQPQITQHKAIEYCQPCEHCSSKDSSPDVFCNIGCYYHGDCLVEVFKRCYATCETKPIAEQSFPCPKCQKSIKLETFLATDSGAKFREICLQVFENKC